MNLLVMIMGQLVSLQNVAKLKLLIQNNFNTGFLITTTGDYN